MKLPVVKREALDEALSNVAAETHLRNLAEIEERNERSRRLNAERELADYRQEVSKKWEPLLRRLMSLTVRRGYDNEFVLNVALARPMMEEIAGYNDQRIWSYISEMVADDLRRQLATLNFSGLHRLAAETERRIHQIIEQRYPLRTFDGPVSTDGLERAKAETVILSGVH